MTCVRVEIRRYVRDDFPGWVECVFADAHGRDWAFVEKVPVISTDPLDAKSHSPLQGFIGCEVIGRRAEVVVIDTTTPWGVEAVSGETRFEVRPEQLVEVAEPRAP